MKRRHVHGVQEKGKSTNPEPTFQCLLGLRGKKKTCRQQESSWLAACFSQVLLLQLLNKLTQHTQALGRVLKYYPPLSHSPST